VYANGLISLRIDYDL